MDAPPSPTFHHAPSSERRRLILVVEDHPDTQSMVADFLAQHGWDVVVASDGDMALRIMRDRHPELVYLDLNLPSSSGYDVCETIRSDGLLKDIPVLMTSARISVDVRAFALEAGANVFLAKPYGLDHLAAVAEKLVSSVVVRR